MKLLKTPSNCCHWYHIPITDKAESNHKKGTSPDTKYGTINHSFLFGRIMLSSQMCLKTGLTSSYHLELIGRIWNNKGQKYPIEASTSNIIKYANYVWINAIYIQHK